MTGWQYAEAIRAVVPAVRSGETMGVAPVRGGHLMFDVREKAS